jgi:hypothetical protein
MSRFLKRHLIQALCLTIIFADGGTDATVVKVDSTIALAKTLIDSNYTVGSFTLLKRAIKKADGTKAQLDIIALKKAIALLEPKEIPYDITININGDPTASLGFGWFTNANCSGGSVQIVEGNIISRAGFATPTSIIAAQSTPVLNLNYNSPGNKLDSLADIPVNTKISFTSNKAFATGLKPATRYSFRVGKDGAWSEIGHFTTAASGKTPFSFIYFTDPQANTDEMFNISQITLHTAIKKFPSANFILSCGDLIESSGANNSEWEYEQFFKTQQDIWLNTPFAPVIGNHDKSTNKNFTAHFNTRATSFDQSLSTTPGSVYSYVWGDALFIAFSTEDYSIPGYLDSLKCWISTQVANHPTIKWKIAYYHKTIYTGSVSHQSDADGKVIRDSLAPLFDSLHIDLALQGHDHIYEVIGPVKNMMLVADAVSNQITTTADTRSNVAGKLGGTFDVTNGTLYFLNNSAGKKKYEPRLKIQMDAIESKIGMSNYFSLFNGRFGQTGEPTFSYVTVSTDSIKISTYIVDEAGIATLFDAFYIIKNSQGASLIGPRATASAQDIRMVDQY